MDIKTLKRVLISDLNIDDELIYEGAGYTVYERGKDYVVIKRCGEVGGFKLLGPDIYVDIIVPKEKKEENNTSHDTVYEHHVCDIIEELEDAGLEEEAGMVERILLSSDESKYYANLVDAIAKLRIARESMLDEDFDAVEESLFSLF